MYIMYYVHNSCYFHPHTCSPLATSLSLSSSSVVGSSWMFSSSGGVVADAFLTAVGESGIGTSEFSNDDDGDSRPNEQYNIEKKH